MNDLTVKQRSTPGRACFKPLNAGLNQLRALYGTRDPRTEFLRALSDSGIHCTEPDRITGDGHLARFHVDGDKANTRNGWAVLFVRINGAGGAFGHWRTGVSETWRGRDSRMSQVRQRQLSTAVRQAQQQREAERRRIHDAARERARILWESADPANLLHPYLVRKRVQPYGIRQSGSLLVVPLRDADGVLWSLEYIGADGTKRFLFGGRKRGCFHVIGEIADKVLIAEGYATAASLYAATGTPTVVAFDAGNLGPVAKVIRAKYPQTDIVLCANNDTGTDGNAGLTKARAAARAVGGTVAIPADGFNDFNDAACGEVV